MENKTKYNDPLAQSSDLDNVSTADEQLIRQFFTERMSEIPDDGFTQRVMNRLPSRTEQWLNRLWIAFCTIAGIVLFVAGCGWRGIWGTLRGLWADVATADWTLWQNPVMIYSMAIFVILAITSHELMEAKY